MGSVNVLAPAPGVPAGGSAAGICSAGNSAVTGGDVPSPAETLGKSAEEPGPVGTGNGGGELSSDATRVTFLQCGQATRRPTHSARLILIRLRQLGQRTAKGVKSFADSEDMPDMPHSRAGNRRDQETYEKRNAYAPHGDSS